MRALVRLRGKKKAKAGKAPAYPPPVTVLGVTYRRKKGKPLTPPWLWVRLH